MPTRSRTLLALAALVAAAPGTARGADPDPDPAPASEPQAVFAPAPADPADPVEPTPPAPPAAPKPEVKYRWQRLPFVPRWIGGGISHGTVKSSAPGIGTQSGVGWNIYFGWDVAKWLDLGFRGGAMHHHVTWTPNPADTSSTAETGFVGVGLLAHLRHDRGIDPWVALDLSFQGPVWDDYLHTVTGWGWVGSAGVDLRPFRWGVLRLGLSYSSFTATTGSPYGPSYPDPMPYDEGAKAGMQTLWLTTAWLFDLGPPSP